MPPHSLLNFNRDSSVVEYTVCTQVCGTGPCPVVGVACIECPTSTLVALFPDEIISLQVTTWYISPHTSLYPFEKGQLFGSVVDEVSVIFNLDKYCN